MYRLKATSHLRIGAKMRWYILNCLPPMVILVLMLTLFLGVTRLWYAPISVGIGMLVTWLAVQLIERRRGA
ncbi:MAG TPA: hypothetical protein VGL35_03820 [Rhizomicrobium sp.]